MLNIEYNTTMQLNIVMGVEVVLFNPWQPKPRFAWHFCLKVNVLVLAALGLPPRS